MAYFFREYKKIIKSICILIIVSFVYSDALWALPDIKISSPTPPPFNLYIPENIGSINRTWNSEDHPNDKPKIFIIQDSHCNLEAQNNISQILGIVNPSLIGLEGAKGKIDTSFLAKIPDKNIRGQIADYYAQKGYLTGAEHFSITKDPSIPLFGLEDEGLYFENLEYFKKAHINKNKALCRIAEKKKSLEERVNLIFSPELKELREKKLAYSGNKILFTDYCKYLNRKLKTNFLNFNLLIKCLALEDRIILKEVENERALLIKGMEERLPKKELEELVKRSLEFRIGKIYGVEYYTYLGQFCDKVKYPSLYGYIKLVKLHEKIDKDLLFNETDRIEELIKESLFRNDEQRRLDKELKSTDILEKLVRLAMTRTDWDLYKEEKQFLFSGEAGKTIKLAERFYNLAAERDESIVNNLLDKINKTKVENAVLVVGGFHTYGLTNYLKGKGISYAVISPRIQDLSSPNPYQSVMMNEKDPLEELLARTGNRIAPVITSPNDLTYTCPEAAEKLGAVVKGAKILSAALRLTQEGGGTLWKKLQGRQITPEEEGNIRQEIVNLINNFWTNWLEGLNEDTRRELFSLWKQIGPVIPKSLKKYGENFILAFDIPGPEDLLLEITKTSKKGKIKIGDLGIDIKENSFFTESTNPTERLKPLEHIFAPIKVWQVRELFGGKIRIAVTGAAGREEQELKEAFKVYFKNHSAVRCLRFSSFKAAIKFTQGAGRKLAFPAKIDPKKVKKFRDQIIDIDEIRGRIIEKEGRREFLLPKDFTEKYKGAIKDEGKFNKIVKRLNELLNELTRFPIGTTVIISATAKNPIFYNRDSNTLEIHGLLLTEDIDFSTTLFAGKHDERHFLISWPKGGEYDLEEEILNIFMDLIYLKEIGKQEETRPYNIIHEISDIEGEQAYSRILWSYMDIEKMDALNEVIGYVIENFPEHAEKFKAKHKIKIDKITGKAVMEYIEKDWQTFGSILQMFIGFYSPGTQDIDIGGMLSQLAQDVLSNIEKLPNLYEVKKEIFNIIRTQDSPIYLKDISEIYAKNTSFHLTQDRIRFILNNLEAENKIARIYYAKNDIRYCANDRIENLLDSKQVIRGEEEKGLSIIYIRSECTNKWAFDLIENLEFSNQFDIIIDTYMKSNPQKDISEFEREIVLLEKAFKVARKDQRERGRKFENTKESYLHHALDIALLMARYNADAAGISTAILHKVDKKVIEDKFSDYHKQINSMINRAGGLDILTNIPLKKPVCELQNFLYLLIILSAKEDNEPDWNVFLFLLLEKLSWLKSLIKYPEAATPWAKDKLRAAVHEYFAPLAEYLGLEEVADELKNSYFKVEEPELYRAINNFIPVSINYAGTFEQLEHEVDNLVTKIKALNAGQDVQDRIKRPFSYKQKLEFRTGRIIKEEGDLRLDDYIKTASKDAAGIQIFLNEPTSKAESALNGVKDKLKGITDLEIPETEDRKLRMVTGYTAYDFIADYKGFKVEIQIFPNQGEYRRYKYGEPAHWLYKLTRYLIKGKDEKTRKRIIRGFDRRFLHETRHLFTKDPKDNFRKLFNVLRDNWTIAGIIAKEGQQDKLHVIRYPKEQNNIPADIANSITINALDESFEGLELVDINSLITEEGKIKHGGRYSITKDMISGVYTIRRKKFDDNSNIKRFREIKGKTIDLRTYLKTSEILGRIKNYSAGGKKLIIDNSNNIIGEKTLYKDLEGTLLRIATEFFGFLNLDEFYSVLYLAYIEDKEGDPRLLYRLLRQIYKVLLNTTVKDDEETLKTTAKLFNIRKLEGKNRIPPVIRLLLAHENGKKSLKYQKDDYRLLLLMDDYNLDNRIQLYTEMGVYPHMSDEILLKLNIVKYPQISFRAADNNKIKDILLNVHNVLEDLDMVVMSEDTNGNDITITSVQLRYQKGSIDEAINLINQIPGIETPQISKEKYYPLDNLKKRIIKISLPEPKGTLDIIRQTVCSLYGKLESSSFKRQEQILILEVILPREINNEQFMDLINKKLIASGLQRIKQTQPEEIEIEIIISTRIILDVAKVEKCLRELEISMSNVNKTRNQLKITCKISKDYDFSKLGNIIAKKLKIPIGSVQVKLPRVRKSHMPGRIKEEKIEWFKRTYGEFGDLEGKIGENRKFRGDIEKIPPVLLSQEFIERYGKKYEELINNLDYLLRNLTAEFGPGTKIIVRTTGAKPIMYNKDDNTLEIHALLLTDEVSDDTRRFAVRHDERHKIIQGLSGVSPHQNKRFWCGDILEEVLNVYMDFFILNSLSKDKERKDRIILNDLNKLENYNGYWRLLGNRRLLEKGKEGQSRLWNKVLEYLWGEEDFRDELNREGIKEFSIKKINKALLKEIRSRVSPAGKYSPLLDFMRITGCECGNFLPAVLPAIAKPFSENTNYLKVEGIKEFKDIEKQVKSDALQNSPFWPKLYGYFIGIPSFVAIFCVSISLFGGITTLILLFIAETIIILHRRYKDRQKAHKDKVSSLINDWFKYEDESAIKTNLIDYFFDEGPDTPPGGELSEVIEGLRIEEVWKIKSGIGREIHVAGGERQTAVLYEDNGYRICGKYQDRKYYFLLAGDGEDIGYYPGGDNWPQEYYSLGKEFTEKHIRSLKGKIERFIPPDPLTSIPTLNAGILLPMTDRDLIEHHAKNNILYRSIFKKFPYPAGDVALPNFAHNIYRVQEEEPGVVACYYPISIYNQGLIFKISGKTICGSISLHELCHAVMDYGKKEEIRGYLEDHAYNELRNIILRHYRFDPQTNIASQMRKEEFAFMLSDFCLMTRPFRFLIDLYEERKELETLPPEKLLGEVYNKLGKLALLYGYNENLTKQIHNLRYNLSIAWNKYKNGKEGIDEFIDKAVDMYINTAKNLISHPPIRLIDAAFFVKLGILDSWAHPLNLGYKYADNAPVDTEYYIRLIEFFIERSQARNGSYTPAVTGNPCDGVPYGKEAMDIAKRIAGELAKSCYGIVSLGDLHDSQIETFKKHHEVQNIIERFIGAEDRIKKESIKHKKPLSLRRLTGAKSILISLIIAPILALILGFTSKIADAQTRSYGAKRPGISIQVPGKYGKIGIQTRIIKEETAKAEKILSKQKKFSLELVLESRFYKTEEKLDLALRIIKDLRPDLYEIYLASAKILIIFDPNFTDSYAEAEINTRRLKGLPPRIKISLPLFKNDIGKPKSSLFLAMAIVHELTHIVRMPVNNITDVIINLHRWAFGNEERYAFEEGDKLAKDFKNRYAENLDLSLYPSYEKVTWIFYEGGRNMMGIGLILLDIIICAVIINIIITLLKIGRWFIRKHRKPEHVKAKPIIKGDTITGIKNRLNELIYNNGLGIEDVRKILTAEEEMTNGFISAEASLKNKINISTVQDQSILYYLLFRTCWGKVNSDLDTQREFLGRVRKKDLEKYSKFTDFFTKLIVLKNNMQINKNASKTAIKEIIDVRKSAVIIDLDILNSPSKNLEENLKKNLKKNLARAINSARGKILFVSADSKIDKSKIDKTMRDLQNSIRSDLDEDIPFKTEVMIRNEGENENNFIERIINKACEDYKIPENEIVLFTTSQMFGSYWRSSIRDILYCILDSDNQCLSSKSILVIKAISGGKILGELESAFNKNGLELKPEYIYLIEEPGAKEVEMAV